METINSQVYTFTVFPDFLNYAGSLFGGKLLSEMDLAASNCARRMLYSTPSNGLVTVHVSEVNFLVPAKLGDIVELHTEVIALGNSSLTIGIKAITENTSGKRDTICTASFVFVSLLDGKPMQHRLNQQRA